MTLAVGFFDGVHVGHQAILKGADAALTFRTHPLAVLAPARAPRLIMDFESRVAAIHACGVREVAALDFTPETARLSPGEFLARAGVSPDTHFRCGVNWRFGRNGAGDAAFLRGCGYSVEVVPSVEFDGERISSTRIRAALERGDVEKATAMMGRPFAARGRVFAGKGEGSRLGCPTVNLAMRSLELRLPLGAYAVEAAGARASANYGVAPTFGARAWDAPVLELHFLGDVPNLPGPDVEVRFLRFLRPERKFASPGELAAQIARDCAEAAQ